MERCVRASVANSISGLVGNPPLSDSSENNQTSDSFGDGMDPCMKIYTCRTGPILPQPASLEPAYAVYYLDW
jgi:hypothetical protein